MALLQTRPATSEDREFVWHVYADYVKPLITPYMTNRKWVDADEKNRFLESWQSDQAHVVSLDGEPVGWFSCDIGQTIVEITHGYVLPMYQNRGIGGHILKFIYEEAEKHNKKVRFTTFKSDPAFRIYGRREFSILHEDNMLVTVQVASI